MAWRWWGWWRRLPGVQVVMYTRRGCHLCDDAWAVLDRARRRYGFALSQVDVDGDPDLVERYGLEVPVVVIDGRVRFRGVVNPVLLERLLRNKVAVGEPGPSGPAGSTAPSSGA